MGTSSFAALAGMGLFAMLVTCVVGILVAALVLGVAFRLVVGYMPSYLRALGAVLLTAVAVVVVSIILRMILPGGLSGLLSLVTQFLVGAAVVNYLLLARNGSRIGYGKACVVQLLYLVIGILLALIIGFIFSMVFGAAMLGMH
ncbi:hypothetical protein ACFPPA_02040 [Rhodanobacter ginsengisoli]|uniref:Uncharacterized protein n=1 Tax=Rhodanobacter ginsengisoli TaxID=418646 RepID=A0ABW0QIU0_9GAMM